MKAYRITGLLLASLFTIPAHAQTASELLQKGIYSQETAGDLDGAIAIYRQIVNSGSSPRDVAAQAQYRLAQSLLQKGDLPNGAQEFSNLARNYADYGKLVSSLAGQAQAGTIRLRLADGPNGRSIFVNGDPQKELKALEASLEAIRAARTASGNSQPDDPAAQALYEKAMDNVKRGEYAAARAQLDSLISTYPASQFMPQAKLAIADVWLRQGGAKSVAQAEAEIRDFEQFYSSGAAGAAAGGRGGRGMAVGSGLSSMSFDSSPMTVTGAAVFKVEWVNPNATISVDPKDGSGKRYTFMMASPNQLLKQGMTRASLNPEDVVTVTGFLATGGQTLPDGTIAASATTVTRADGRKLFDRSAVQQ
jgi:TolA-binding protein